MMRSNTFFYGVFGLIIGLFLAVVHASETDGFTPRYVEIEDSLAILNTKMASELDSAAQKANRVPGCSTVALFDALKDHLRRPLFGRIEGWIVNSGEVPKFLISAKSSVYKYIPVWERAPTVLGHMGFGAAIRVNGELVGSDKFGHFFDEGWKYYTTVVEKGRAIEKAYEYGAMTESGIFGLKTTGISSYGDMSANFNGMLFWARVVGPALVGKHEPYFSCQNGEWTRVAKFDWSDYVDASWDEGINCSAFRSHSYADRVKKAIHELEASDGKPYACPVLPQRCADVAPKYGVFGTYLLSEPCKKAATELGGVKFEELQETPPGVF